MQEYLKKDGKPQKKESVRNPGNKISFTQKRKIEAQC
jgi:hypothetical protein